jgi:hypothetical protein
MVQEIVKRNSVELVTGITFCPYCLSTNVEETDTFTVCRDCGMGKNKSGRR